MTFEQPGGDASDPHLAALDRLLAQPWGWRTDKDAQLRVPLADAKNWKRVRFWSVDHFVGFRYGKDIHAVTAVFVQAVPATEAGSAAACMRRFESWGQPELRDFHVRLGSIAARTKVWKNQTVLVHQTQATAPFGFETSELSVAWAAYPVYPDACLVVALAVPWRDQRSQANAVIERWIDQGLGRIQPLTQDRPYRK